MNIITNKLINNNTQYYNYKIDIGFYDYKNKLFKYYISKINYYNILKKFDKKKNKKKIKLYKYNNYYYLIKNNDILYYKITNDNYFYIKNNNNNSNFFNYSYLLFKTEIINKINSIDFNLNKSELLDKEITYYKFNYNKSIIILNFEIINNDNYSINLKSNFDKENINDFLHNLNYILNIIYNNNDFNIIK
tara:strand:- start:4098 stop:4670 length:573 start_codon:yes stop_codon:yes gene_type:complete